MSLFISSPVVAWLCLGLLMRDWLPSFLLHIWKVWLGVRTSPGLAQTGNPLISGKCSYISFQKNYFKTVLACVTWRPRGRGLSLADSPSTPTQPRDPLPYSQTWYRGLSAKQNPNEKCWYLMKYNFEDFTKEICCHCFNLLGGRVMCRWYIQSYFLTVLQSKLICGLMTFIKMK